MSHCSQIPQKLSPASPTILLLFQCGLVSMQNLEAPNSDQIELIFYKLLINNKYKIYLFIVFKDIIFVNIMYDVAGVIVVCLT